MSGQQPNSSQSKTTLTTQHQQQLKQVKQNVPNNTPPSIERPGPEGEADEEEPSEVGNSVTPFLFLEFLADYLKHGFDFGDFIFKFLFQIDSFLLDDNEIESEEENLTRTSNSSPIPNIDQLSPDKEYLGDDNNEDEEDSDDLDADLRAVNAIASSTSHRRFLLTG